MIYPQQMPQNYKNVRNLHHPASAICDVNQPDLTAGTTI
jgi:hypothetical protein